MTQNSLALSWVQGFSTNVWTILEEQICNGRLFLCQKADDHCYYPRFWHSHLIWESGLLHFRLRRFCVCVCVVLEGPCLNTSPSLPPHPKRLWYFNSLAGTSEKIIFPNVSDKHAKHSASKVLTATTELNPTDCSDTKRGSAPAHGVFTPYTKHQPGYLSHLLDVLVTVTKILLKVDSIVMLQQWSVKDTPTQRWNNVHTMCMNEQWKCTETIYCFWQSLLRFCFIKFQYWISFRRVLASSHVADLKFANGKVNWNCCLSVPIDSL